MKETSGGDLTTRLQLVCSLGLALGFLVGGLSDSSEARPHRVAPAGPLRLLPTNAHYFEYNGTPTILVGATGSYMMVSFLHENFGAFLNQIASSHLNVTRLFCYVPQVWGNAENRDDAVHYIAPWVKTGDGKYDLDHWNAAWFRRLKEYVSHARARHIVVEIVLFTQMYNDWTWTHTPLYAGMNVQGVGNVTWDQFTTMTDPTLVARQEALVHQIVTELNGYNNVYYEISNETRGGPWLRHILKTITDTESALPKRHLIGFQDPSDLQDPAITVHNFHYTWGASWVGAMEALDRFGTLNAPLAFNETNVTFRDATTDQARIEAWEFLVGGGALYNNLNWDWQTAEAHSLREQLRVLKEFLGGFHFGTMTPDVSILMAGIPSGARARVLKQVGHQYAIYLHHGQDPTNSHSGYTPAYGTYQAHLSVRLPAGAYTAEWVSPAHGVTLSHQTFMHSGGNRALQSPTYALDIALRIKSLPVGGKTGGRRRPKNY
jgi:hypothetical protein